MTGLSEADLPLDSGSQDESVPLTPDFEQRLPHVTRDDMNRFVAEDLYYAMEEFIPGAEDDEIPPVHAEINEEMYAQGADMQGIDWEHQLLNRKQTRAKRVEEFVNYLSLGDEYEEDGISIDSVQDNREFFDFKYARLDQRCSIGHFQLRNLLWATSKNDVYYVFEDTVRHWSPQLCQSQEVLNVSLANSPQSLVFKISSMACAYNILFVGGSMGEFACRRLDNINSPVHYGITTDHSNGIANHVNITNNRRGEIQAVVSSNDRKTRYINMERMTIEKTMSFPFAVNCSALSPQKELLCVVGDSTTTLVVDAITGKTVMDWDEHHDFSFACCWSPDGKMLATGNQDKTTRIYDIRFPSEALYVLGGKVGAIRSLQYSRDGKFLIAAEPIDFVHIYDTTDYKSSQVIDMFGDIAGVNITPDDQALFIANTDHRQGGIFEFQRIHSDFFSIL
ncbi:hypothetical protein VTP01DRAFT_10473 [Rhizomucor pusillus]|uniref:uncharacterized protein n=1 Tax=Rhizomucor pusillus TaxID=4840 RepID=UPI0037438CEC